jgi:hypothetical protein
MVWMKSDYPGQLREPVEYFYMTVLHEIGHVLGLAHAAPLLTSNDLMAYGEFIADPESPDPVLSQCDVDALAATWTAYLAGQASPPTYQC